MIDRLNNMGTIWRTPQIDDLTEVLSLLEHLSKYPFKSEKNMMLFWEQFLNNKSSYSLLAELDGKVVAFGYCLYYLTPRGGVVGRLEEIVVMPTYQGNGLGSQLVSKLILHAKNIFGCYKVEICCSSKNQDFYIKNGFTSQGISMKQH